MTFAQLKAAIAAADAKGLPADAVVVCNGTALNATYHIQLGKYLEAGGSAESIETRPELQLVS